MAIAARRCVSRREASGRDAAVGRPAPRQQVVQTRDRPLERRRRPRPGRCRRRTDTRRRRPGRCRRAGSASGPGAPASGSAGRTGTRIRPRVVGATSVASNAIAPSLPEPSAALKRWWRCSIADCGWSVTIASLSSSGPSWATMFGEISTSESPTVTSPRQTSGSSPFDGRPRSRCGSGSVESRAWRMRYASAGPDRRHVHLVAADDADADADRAVVARATSGRGDRPGAGAACWRSRWPSAGRHGSRPIRRSSTRSGSSRPRAASPPAHGASSSAT